MKTKLTNNVGNLEIKKEDTIEKMCSLSDDVVGKKCLSEGNDACGDNSCTTSDRYVKILDFRHFERFFRFDQSDRKTYKKAISDGVNVSVVLDSVCGNTSKYN